MIVTDIFRYLVAHLAPLFLISSPILSYADQIYSIHRTRNSSGFSLDIPLIMLIASIAKIFFWLGNPYDMSLLIQAINTVVVQVILLYVALANRVAPDTTTPFANAQEEKTPRPYNFWQWRSARPYWLFLAYFALGLLVAHFILGGVELYVQSLGYMALAVEALLPVPQILSNQRHRSTKGFRPSVLINWLGGDVFKMSFFLMSETKIPLAFKLCGLFQFACDIYLGVQYATFGEGKEQMQQVWEMVERKVNSRGA